MVEPIHIELPDGQTLPRPLDPQERGTLWLVALYLVQVRNTTGYGEIKVLVHQGNVVMVERSEKTKRIPDL